MFRYLRVNVLEGGAGPDDHAIQAYAAGAMRHAVEATTLSLSIGDSERVYLGRYLQVGALMAARDLTRARRESEGMLHAGAAAEPEVAERCRANTLKLLGGIELLEGFVDAAETRTLEALALFEEQRDLRQAADCFRTLSDITESKGDFKAALGWHRRCFDAVTRFASESAQAHAAAMEVRKETERARALAAVQQARADRLECSNNDLVRETERLTRTALEDALTGIANHRRLDQELAALVTDRRGRQRCSLALLDIDHFKQINDRFLHTTGDKVLARLGAILRLCSRENDLVARFGGEEFAIVFVGIDTDEVALACERIRQAVAGAEWSALHPELRVTASIGFCHFVETSGQR